VTRFNAMINARDADGLARLMTDDHRFVDSAGQAVSGRQACRDAWSGFFAAFPGYRNVLDSVGERDGVVVVTGRSVCSEHPDLAGPALWTARVDGGLVAEWRVYDDTPETRAELGVTA
jgi:ketosteroid isomerase-like protein